MEEFCRGTSRPPDNNNNNNDVVVRRCPVSLLLYLPTQRP